MVSVLEKIQQQAKSTIHCDESDAQQFSKIICEISKQKSATQEQLERTVNELKEKVESYEDNMAAIVEAKLKTKEQELEERFEKQCHHLQALESSIVQKLKLSEFHTVALHSVLKSAMSELDQLRAELSIVSASTSLNLEQESYAKNMLKPFHLVEDDQGVRCEISKLDDVQAVQAKQSLACQDESRSYPNDSWDGKSLLKCEDSGGEAAESFLNFSAGFVPCELSASQALSSLSSSACTVYNASNTRHFTISGSALPSASHDALKSNLILPSPFNYDSSSLSSSSSSMEGHLSSTSMDILGIVKAENIETDEVLDTSAVALRMREILMKHNIGQRQFAKQVLNLSQGTVSELLSKPKSWDKLTEKGRESYRKMQLWASDETNILELKMSLNKNGDSVVRSEDQHDNLLDTEQRVAQILFKAQEAMLNGEDLMGKVKPHVTSVTEDLKTVQTKHSMDVELATLKQKMLHRHKQKSVTSSLTVSTPGKLVGQQLIDGNTCNSNSQNLVVRIYREQLLQLIETAEKSGNKEEVERYRRDLLLSFTLTRQNQMEEKSFPRKDMQDSTMSDSTINDSLKEIIELSGKHDSHALVDSPENLSFKNCPTSVATNKNESVLHLSVCSVHSHSENHSTTSTTDSTASGDELLSLEQMQYIGNSVVSKSPPISNNSSPPHLIGVGDLAALSAISQDQWDYCIDLDTDEVVQRVKDMLSEYSISQRLFGEHILGLSQGSVSDLLARPKPWHMLTQKGREPFVRMKAFLDDPSSVHNLVTNQYRAPADKCLRSNSFSYEESVPQGRKRKSSVDDGLTGSQSSSQKKARVSFTEEQKEALLLAYDSDQYPNQAIIEQLASGFGIQEKTVINWFHNHRMRDKNRFLSWSPTCSSQGACALSIPIKTELLEDMSSQSCDSASNLTQCMLAVPIVPVGYSVCTDKSENKFGGDGKKAASVIDNKIEPVGSCFNCDCLPLEDRGAMIGKRKDLQCIVVVSRSQCGTNGISKRKSARPQRLNSEFIHV